MHDTSMSLQRGVSMQEMRQQDSDSPIGVKDGKKSDDVIDSSSSRVTDSGTKGARSHPTVETHDQLGSLFAPTTMPLLTTK